ncbi:MAG: hypothetical protein ACKV2V_16420 [Blastocatellia bacterium]
MSTKNPSRRTTIETLSTGSAGLMLATLAPGSARQTAPATHASAFRGEHQPRPLPFDPTKLKGLSEKLLRSPHENNSFGAVATFNVIENPLTGLRG